MTDHQEWKNREYYVGLLKKDPDQLTDEELDEMQLFFASENDIHEETRFEVWLEHVRGQTRTAEEKALVDRTLLEILFERTHENPPVGFPHNDPLVGCVQDYVESHPDSPSTLKDWLATVLRDAPKPDLVLYLNDHRKHNLKFPQDKEEICPAIEETGTYTLRSPDGKFLWSEHIQLPRSEQAEFEIAAKTELTPAGKGELSRTNTADGRYQVLVHRIKGNTQIIITSLK